MTFHFAHMAPPGAVSFSNATSTARWARCALMPRRVMHWDRPGDVPVIPAQHEPVPAAPLQAGSRAA